MKKNQILGMLLFAALLSFGLQSCDDDEPEPDPGLTDFIADDATFAGFESWGTAITTNGPSASLSGAHGADNAAITRTTYFKDGAVRGANGTYPIGTLVAKAMRDSTGTWANGFGMAKRAVGFSTEGDWEWFFLNEDGSIQVEEGEQRRGGADFLGCGDCHMGASANDFTFSK